MIATPGRALVFAIPGDLASPSGGYGYDRRMIEELGELGWRVQVLPLPGSFPKPDIADLAAATEAFARLPDGALVLVDGLAFGALPDLARREAKRLHLVALVHHPLALEDGLAPADAEVLRSSERVALAEARAMVATSNATARLLRDEFGVGRTVSVAPPGTDRPAVATGERDGSTPTILSVGALIQRKDHALLVDALASLADRRWRCRIVGSETAHPATARALRARIEAAGLGQRITLAGTVPDVGAEYRDADIFALPSRFEGYGMAFAEAMAHGLPVVGCRGGAVADVVPPRAGRLVEPGDHAGFTRALRMLLDDPALRRTLGTGARDAARALPTWAASARILSQALEGVR